MRVRGLGKIALRVPPWDSVYTYIRIKIKNIKKRNRNRICRAVLSLSAIDEGRFGMATLWPNILTDREPSFLDANTYGRTWRPNRLPSKTMRRRRTIEIEFVSQLKISPMIPAFERFYARAQVHDGYRYFRVSFPGNARDILKKMTLSYVAKAFMGWKASVSTIENSSSEL